MRHNSFGKEIIPHNDEDRLQKLYNYHILDTGLEDVKNVDAEGTFRHVVTLASHLFAVPIAMISFVDRDRVWFKAGMGLDGLQQVDRGISICSLSILNEEPTVFHDALEETCLLANPFVAGEMGLRFYAAAPLTTHDGFHLGSVCILDREPREFKKEDEITLKYLAKLVMEQLELWKYSAQQTEEVAVR